MKKVVKSEIEISDDMLKRLLREVARLSNKILDDKNYDEIYHMSEETRKKVKTLCNNFLDTIIYELELDRG